MPVHKLMSDVALIDKTFHQQAFAEKDDPFAVVKQFLAVVVVGSAGLQDKAV